MDDRLPLPDRPLKYCSNRELLEELARRWRERPGAWTGYEQDQVRMLDQVVNPPSLLGT